MDIVTLCEVESRTLDQSPDAKSYLRMQVSNLNGEFALELRSMRDAFFV
jgi:hypothetical protein